MAELTIRIDAATLEAAREKARSEGTSLEALVREHLKQYVGRAAQQRRVAEAFLALAEASTARHGRSRWAREDLHERHE